MIKIENVEVVGWEHSIRGMRNQMNSWNKSDSVNKCPYNPDDICDGCKNINIGPNDHNLMMNLKNAGSDH